MYEAAYRQALHGAGFGDLRVLTAARPAHRRYRGGGRSGDGASWTGVSFSSAARPAAGDLVNAAAYQIRPYEVVPGLTNGVVNDAPPFWPRRFGSRAPSGPHCDGFVPSIVTSTRLTRAKPKVKIIGEFWRRPRRRRLVPAAELARAEGAEVLTEPLAAWFDYCSVGADHHG